MYQTFDVERRGNEVGAIRFITPIPWPRFDGDDSLGVEGIGKHLDALVETGKPTDAGRVEALVEALREVLDGNEVILSDVSQTEDEAVGVPDVLARVAAFLRTVDVEKAEEVEAVLDDLAGRARRIEEHMARLRRWTEESREKLDKVQSK